MQPVSIEGAARWWRVLLIGLGTAIAPLDSAVNVGFPAITAAFGGPLTAIQWVIIAYLLTFASSMLAVGRIGDLSSHAGVFRLGLAWSAVALAGCALAPSFPLLLAARAAQGVGAALVLACGPALLTALFPPAQRARALGLYAMMFALGAAAGPVIGGLMVGAFGWPGVFGFRVPLALLALLLLPALPRPAPVAGPRAGFDAAGALLLAGALAALLLGLARIGARDPLALALLVGAGAGFVLFVRRQRRAAAPLIDLAPFARPGFTAINLGSVAVNLASFAILLLLPYQLAGARGLAPGPAGLVLAAAGLGTALGSPAAPGLIARLGAPAVAMLGAGLGALGLGAIALAEMPPLTWLIGLLLAQGLGLGLFQVACLEIVTGAMPPTARGVAGSLALLTRTLGLVLGAAVLTLVYGIVEAQAEGDAAARFQTGFQLTFLFAAGVSGLAALAGLARPRRP